MRFWGIDNESFCLYLYIKTKRRAREVEKTWKPTTAGVLCIVAGSFAVIGGLVAGLIGGLIGGFLGIPWTGVFGIPSLTLGIIAIIGGIFALKRQVWGLALAGSICALVGPWAILGLLAIIFVSLGKGEFK